MHKVCFLRKDEAISSSLIGGKMWPDGKKLSHWPSRKLPYVYGFLVTPCVCLLIDWETFFYFHPLLLSVVCFVFCADLTLLRTIRVIFSFAATERKKETSNKNLQYNWQSSSRKWKVKQFSTKHFRNINVCLNQRVRCNKFHRLLIW